MGAGKPEWPELKMEVNISMTMVVITMEVIPLVVVVVNNMMMVVMVVITLAVIHLVVVVVNNMMIMVMVVCL